MITREQVIKAMQLINYPKQYATAIEKQIALSLRVYKDRGEYCPDNYNQAVNCLLQAGYEIEGFCV